MEEPRDAHRSATEPDEDGLIERVTIVGELERQRVEALRLEIRRLGRRYGVEVRESPREASSE